MLTVQQAFALALQHHQSGRHTEAEALYRQILAVQSNHAVARNNLGILLAGRNQWDEAISAFQSAIESAPEYTTAHFNLANALRTLGQFQLAITHYRRSLQFQPSQPQAENNLGVAFAEHGQPDEAIAAYRRALVMRPDYPEAWNNLGAALREHGRIEEAIAACRRALTFHPDYAEGHNNLGNALRDCDDLDEAVAAFERAIQLKPDFWEAESNLGNGLRDQGRLDSARAAYRRALSRNPDDSRVYDELIYATLLDPALDAARIREEQHRWNRQFGEPARRFILSHTGDRNPDRRLRIGYVSPDLREHVVGRNVLPLFKHHRHDHFEILCYAGALRSDKLTQEFGRCADHWRTTIGVSDAALAQMVREDHVDILVDLAQHMGGNRLTMFARQPAPVQVSFAGYPESTGVEAIEYRISDRWLEMAMTAERSETACGRNGANDECRMTKAGETKEWVYLLDSFWCYDPCGLEVAVNALPAKGNGHITFGSLNNFCKVNEPVLQLWARVLREVSDSRLVILSGFGSHRRRTVDILEQEGVAPQRVEFVEPRPRKEYLELYHRLDCVLDTFPYNGHTTSLDALWMGVPVVSLCGERPVSHAGLSQLSNLGLPELVAHSENEYVKIAVRLAGDLPRLAELRQNLRARMEASVLMDAPHFARQIERAYRAMWRHWCAETVT